MKKLEERINRSLKRVDKLIELTLRDSSNIPKVAFNLKSMHYDLAILHSHIGEFKIAKQHFYTAAILDTIRIKRFNNRSLDYDLPNVCNAVLSDNEQVIKEYAKLRYHKAENVELSMDEMVQNGETAIWSNTIQFFMQNDMESVKRNLKIIETKTLPKLPKNQEELKIDFEFYKALLANDKSRCEELLQELVSPKVCKKRNDNPILNKYVSQPALGYAKLAWRLGVEVEIDSPLIPKELLPILPLNDYSIPYEFLKSGT